MRIEEDLLQKVRLVAKKRGVTLTFLVDQHFRQLVAEELRPKTDEDLGVEQV